VYAHRKGYYGTEKNHDTAQQCRKDIQNIRQPLFVWQAEWQSRAGCLRQIVICAGKTQETK
jgi:hypothetical protein